MSKMEELLNDKKIEIDELVIPDELEARLNKALEGRAPAMRKKNNWKMKIAILIIAFMLITYNADTLAFYGKELLGFDSIMSGTLKELNKMGMGQIIDQSYTFSNGVKVTLNGVMVDENRLLAFYTIEGPRGSMDKVQIYSTYMKGAFGIIHQRNAQGQSGEDESIIRWIGEFETPIVTEKELTWVFDTVIDGKTEEGSISFILDRDKAMGATLKDRFNKSVKIDDGSVRFNTIIASPTITIIKGTIQNILELALGQISGERIYAPSLDIRLIANGMEVMQQGISVGTDMKGIRFEARYDALPRDLKKLQLHIVSFGAIHDVNEQVPLKQNDINRVIQVKGQDITINKIEKVNGETHITITTDKSVVLTKVYLLADNNKAELLQTIEGQRDKKPDGTITHIRTLRFKATGKDLKLDIKRIRYEQACDEYIDIPID